MIFEAHPKAAVVQDFWGRLSLHYALDSHASNNIIYMVVKAYPELAQVQDKSGCLPLHHACQYPMYYYEEFL
jgi:hypothetical protein